MLSDFLHRMILKKLKAQTQIPHLARSVDKGKPVAFVPISSRIITKNPETDTFVGGTTRIWQGRMLKENDERLTDSSTVYQIPSTAIASVRYDPKTNHLYQKFKGGDKEYVYDITPEEFKRYMQAGSKGRYTNYVLKYKNRAPASWWS